MFKHFNDEQKNIYEFRAHKTYTLNQSNLTRYHFLSASNNSTSASYYHFARINFYLSGSDLANSNPKFNTYPTVGNKFNNDKMFFNKFYQSGSLISIPQSQFGDGIKRGTFTLTDNSTAATIKITDDSNGNLYSTNASFSQSVSHLSSSDNYVGNIFYDIGVFSITETASFDGSVNYSDVTSGNYSVTYKGTHDISTYDWTCDLLPNEMNLTENITIFKHQGAGDLKDNLTSSLFPTYITEVGLYDDTKNLIGYARVSKPIPKSSKMPMSFFIRMDH